MSGPLCCDNPSGWCFRQRSVLAPDGKMFCYKCSYELLPPQLCKQRTKGLVLGSQTENNPFQPPEFTFDERYYRGKIYQLKHIDANQCLYVGQTISSLNTRLRKHKQPARSGRISKIKEYMKEHGRDGLSIEMTEEYPCYNKESLAHREQYWIDKLNPVMNMVREIY